MDCIYTLEDLSSAETVFETLDQCVIIYRMPNKDYVVVRDKQHLKSFKGRLHAFEEAVQLMETQSQITRHGLSTLSRLIKDESYSREFLAKYCDEILMN